MKRSTPGPWKISRQKNKQGVHLSEPRFIEAEEPLKGDGEAVCMFGAGIVHFANSEANARLIAAAPDLLAAALLVTESSDHGDEAGLGELRAAIKQATGRKS